jgi:hypothetical protein
MAASLGGGIPHHFRPGLEPGHATSIPATAQGSEQVILVSHDFAKVNRLNGSNRGRYACLGNVGKRRYHAYLDRAGGVSYVNCEVDAPISMAPNESVYQSLPTGPMVTDARCCGPTRISSWPSG